MASALLVHLSGGRIELHFHFFVMMSVIVLYQDWLPFWSDCCLSSLIMGF